MRKRCFIYCGLLPKKEKQDIGILRKKFIQYAERKNYKVITFYAEVMNDKFQRCTGAVEVIKTIKDKKIDVLLITKGILNDEEKVIYDFKKFAKKKKVEIVELDIDSVGGKS